MTWTTPVFSFSTVTFACGTAPPLASTTRPCKIPVAVCALAQMQNAIAAARTLNIFDIRTPSVRNLPLMKEVYTHSLLLSPGHQHAKMDRETRPAGVAINAL